MWRALRSAFIEQKGISAPNQWLASPTAALANARTFDKIPLWRSILCSRNVSRTICHDPDRRSVHRCVIFSRWAWGSSLEFTRDPACAMRKSEPQRRRDAEIPRQRRRPRVDCDFAFPARAQLAPSSPSQWRRTVERPRLGLSAPLRLCGSPSFLRLAWGSSFNFTARAPAFVCLHLRPDRPSSAGHGVHRSDSQTGPAASPRASRLDRLGSSASVCGLRYLPPAGHGVLRSFLHRAPLHRGSV
jgi:hypothetical protein